MDLLVEYQAHAVPAAVLAVIAAISASTPRVLDLKKQFSFYAAYHVNGLNQIIHILCIWPILWTAMVFFALGPQFPAKFLDMPLNWSAVLALVYGLYYLVMEPIYGLSPALIGAVWYSSNLFVHAFKEDALKIALMIHVGGWLLQFFGHGVFERRAPALLDNLAQALLMAPLFVLLEVMFKLGYRPKLFAEVQKMVDAEVRSFRAKGSKKAE